MKILTQYLLVSFLCVSMAQSSLAAKRVALVIGNSAYQHAAELKNPRNDARDIAKTLKSIGFDDVELKEDLDYRGMRTALRDFIQSSQGAEMTFVFYAGHSIEVNKKNYLVPVDAKLANIVDVDFEAIQLDQVRTAASSASKLKMVILDACRNNPFKMAGRSGTRSLSRGLAIVEPGSGELIAYAAKEGTTAQDGEKSRNSPFTTALLKNLRNPGVEVRVMFGQIRDDVLSATSGQQQPYTYASLGGQQLYLHGRPTAEAPSTAPRPAYQAPPPISKEIQEAAAAWAATKDTESVGILEAFRNRYAGTVYADMAKAKAEELATQQRDRQQKEELRRSQAASLEKQRTQEERQRRKPGTMVDPSTGISLHLPSSLQNRGRSHSYGTNWSSGRNGIEVDSLRYFGSDCLRFRMQRIRNGKRNRPSQYYIGSQTAEIAGRERSEKYWVQIEQRGSECRGLSLVVSNRARSHHYQLFDKIRRSYVPFP